MKLLSFPFVLVIEWLCFFTAMLLLRKTSPKFWQTFIVYLGLTATVETYAYVSIVFFGNTNTHILYNIFLMVYIGFHLFIFSKIIDLNHANKIIALALILLFGLYAYELFSDGRQFFSLTNTVFGGVIILLSIIYYFSIFKQEELKQAEFWLVTGCLIFYGVTTGVNAFFDQLVQIDEKSHFPIRYVIVTLANLTMFSCWIKSFLCVKQKQIYFQR